MNGALVNVRRRHGIGDWIRLTSDFFTKPEVLWIAEQIGGQMVLAFDGTNRTNVLQHVAVSGLVRVFLAVNRHAHECRDGTKDVELSSVFTDDYLDSLSAVAGMQAALLKVGWVSHDRAAGVLRFHNYLTYNDLAKGEKRRGRPGNPNSDEARRKREARQKAKGPSGGQMPDNSELSGNSFAGQMPDKQAEKETELEQKEKNFEQKESDNSVERPPVKDVDFLKREVDSLRPDTWGSVPHWGYDDEAALLPARVAVDGWRSARKDLDGRSTFDLLRWWLSWVARQARTAGNEDKGRFAVTSKRALFLEGLAGYVSRAKEDWLRERRPALVVRETPPAKKPELAAPRVSLPEISPEQARENAARFAALVKSPVGTPL